MEISRMPISLGRFHLTPGSIWDKLKTVHKGPSGEGWDDLWDENATIEAIRKAGGVFVNDTFMDICQVDEGLLFLDGGYGSSKTTYVITRLLIKAMNNKYFKCFYGRQKKTEARELHDNIIREIKRNNWEKNWDFSEKPNGTTDIVYLPNGNKFKLFGCDDDDSLKGIDNPSDILVDEINQISFESFGMLLTRLRGSGYKLQMIGCFNNCDVYPDHWLVKYIYGNEDVKTQSDAEKIIAESLSKTNITKHHSTYLDNYFQNPKQYYEKLRIKAGGVQSKIDAYCRGDWGVKLSGQPFYKNFLQEREVVDNEQVIDGFLVNKEDGALGYNPNIPIHISFDENSNPYLPALLLQTDGNDVYVIDEIAAKNPYNTLQWICSEICSRYRGHKGGVYVYGDATSVKQDVKVEKGQNVYTIIMGFLEVFKPVLRVQESNPNVNMRGNFINAIFALNYEKIRVKILKKCKHLVEDLLHTQEHPEGKGKDKSKVMVDGIRGVQKYGHFSDCFDYFMCEFFLYQFILYQNSGYTHKVTGGKRQESNNSIERLEAIERKEEKVLTRLLKKQNRKDEESEDDTEDIEEYTTVYGWKRSSRNGYS